MVLVCWCDFGRVTATLCRCCTAARFARSAHRTRYTTGAYDGDEEEVACSCCMCEKRSNVCVWDWTERGKQVTIGDGPQQGTVFCNRFVVRTVTILELYMRQWFVDDCSGTVDYNVTYIDYTNIHFCFEKICLRTDFYWTLVCAGDWKK